MWGYFLLCSLKKLNLISILEYTRSTHEYQNDLQGREKTEPRAGRNRLPLLQYLRMLPSEDEAQVQALGSSGQEARTQ